MFQVISIVLLGGYKVPLSEWLLGCSEGVARQLKILFQFFYFRVSYLIQCVTCCFFVIVCEIYLQILSENCFYTNLFLSVVWAECLYVILNAATVTSTFSPTVNMSNSFIAAPSDHQAVGELLSSTNIYTSPVVHRLYFHDLFTVLWGVNISCGRQTVFPDSNESLWSAAQPSSSTFDVIAFHFPKGPQGQGCTALKKFWGSTGQVWVRIQNTQRASGQGYRPAAQSDQTLTGRPQQAFISAHSVLFNTALAHYAHVHFSAFSRINTVWCGCLAESPSFCSG